MKTVHLSQFRKKHEEWCSCLNGHDLHSIWKQQSSLLGDYALFLTINDLVKASAKRRIKGVGFNGPVLRLFVTGFLVSQVTGIRRLAERQWSHPAKRVISLRALVEDIRANRRLLTRDVYLISNELPFDPTPAKQKCFERAASSGERFFFEGMESKGSEAWAASERVHERFDKLSGTSSSGRSARDLISLKWFDLLDSKIRGCEDVCVFTDKFIAHAAHPTSRTGLNDKQKKVTLARLAECHHAMVQVGCFIGGPILQDTFPTGAPVPQFDVLENLDKAWVSAEGLEKAREIWQQHADEIEGWSARSLL